MTTNSTKALITKAFQGLFVDRDPSALDRYVEPSYRQHSAFAKDGAEGLRELIAGLGKDFRGEPARMLADGDLVAVHGLYTGLGPEPLVAFDVFRVRGGKLVEHWDATQPKADKSVSGHSQLDGPAEVSSNGQTDISRKIAEDFVDTVIIQQKYDQLPAFYVKDLVQHNPGVGDGIEGLTAALHHFAEQGITMEYDRRHFTVAEGDFVLIASQGRFGGTPTAFYDLFRVADGMIVEHWDVIAEIPEQMPHSNGFF